MFTPPICEVFRAKVWEMKALVPSEYQFSEEMQRLLDNFLQDLAEIEEQE